MKKNPRPWWLILGILAYLLIALSSIARVITTGGLAENIYASIDWLAASVPYFFYGAAIGHLISWLKDRKIQHPRWLFFTVVFWALATIGALIRTSNISEALLFPFAYGIFFSGVAFLALLPGFVQKTYWGKFVLDLVFLSAAYGWLWLTIKDRMPSVREVLLYGIFAILFLGMAACVMKF